MGYIYHHMGIPISETRDDETEVEAGGIRFTSTPFNQNRWKIQWHRYSKDCNLHPLIREKPHVAFKVDDLEATIEGCEVILAPYEPIPGFKVAFINEQGVPIELIETELTDIEIARIEEEKLGKKTS